MSASLPADPATGRIRVLVLDDEDAVRRLVRMALEQHGFEVETAEDGRLGLQLLLQKDFDVTIVDIRMLEMDGLTFIQEARHIWPWLGIIVITGCADARTIEEAGRLGVKAVLEKPLELAELCAQVEKEYAGKQQRLEGLPPQRFDQVQYQLNLLRDLGELAIEGKSLIETLHHTSRGLAEHFPCDAFAVLGLEGDEQILIQALQRPMPPSFLETIQTEMLERYQALSGHSLSAGTLDIEIEGAPVDASLPDISDHSTFTVPVMANQKVAALFMLACEGKDAYDARDLTFLYHAANQFSTVLGALRRMRSLALHDPLTGLYNRNQLQTGIKQACELCKRHKLPLSVVVMDIDRFKVLNDAHGHLNGDRLIRAFADVLRKVTRASDLIGRFGGDEFIAVLPQTAAPDAIRFCDRLQDTLKRSPVQIGDREVILSASMGICHNLESGEEASGTRLLERADQAMYAAKRDGRAQAVVWDPSHEEEKEGATEGASVEAASPFTPHMPKILVVDDDPAICRLLQRMLSRASYRVEIESTIKGGLQKLQGRQGDDFDVLITDLQLSEESGLDFLEKLKGRHRNLVKIVITGNATVDNAIASLRHGAYDFIEKPISREQLLAILDRGLEFRRLSIENRRYQQHLEEMVQEKSAALTRALQEIKTSYDFTLEALVRLLDAREQTTGQHSIRVRDLAVILGREMGLPEPDIAELSRGAILHDIGKIAIPDAILLKPAHLSDDEWEVMKSHAQVGYNVLQSSEYLRTAAELVLSHHEKYDGTGYPRGLSGNGICIGARIFAVVDAYDAMRSHRVYREAMSAEAAHDEIKRSSGSHFDPRVVEAFIRAQSALEDAGQWPT